MKTLWTFNIGKTRYLIQSTKNGEWVSVNNMDTGQVWEVEGIYFNQYCDELTQVAKQFHQIQNLNRTNSLSEHMIEVEKYEDKEIKFENSKQEDLYNTLKIWRTAESNKQELPAYIIFNNITLFQIAKYQPSTKMDLMKINGIGKVKLEKYGSDLINSGRMGEDMVGHGGGVLRVQCGKGLIFIYPQINVKGVYLVLATLNVNVSIDNHSIPPLIINFF